MTDSMQETITTACEQFEEKARILYSGKADEIDRSEYAAAWTVIAMCADDPVADAARPVFRFLDSKFPNPSSDEEFYAAVDAFKNVTK
jgi:hypothetical protein